MAEQTVKTGFRRAIIHRGRVNQLPIYLGKQFRGFVYQNDWKMLPAAGVIALLVSLVVRNACFVTMEGTLMGTLSLTCVALWNGCFNSIQAVCRERAIVKREHRSGMHVSAYVAAHMIYQGLMCLAQTVLSVVIYKMMGVKFPEAGLVTPWMTVDLAISLFLISYAADMIALLVSCLVRTSTAAMTIMPFLLIFQLVFAGTVFKLPERVQWMSKFALSSYGQSAILTVADYNSLPLVSGWSSLERLSDREVELQTTVGEISEKLKDESNGAIQRIRALKLTDLLTEEGGQGEVVYTVGELIDDVSGSEWAAQNADQVLKLKCKVGEVIDLFGRDTVKNAIQNETAKGNYNARYVHESGMVAKYWFELICFALGFAAVAVFLLERIDKDKR